MSLKGTDRRWCEEPEGETRRDEGRLPTYIYKTENERKSDLQCTELVQHWIFLENKGNPQEGKDQSRRIQLKFITGKNISFIKRTHTEGLSIVYIYNDNIKIFLPWEDRE